MNGDLLKGSLSERKDGRYQAMRSLGAIIELLIAKKGGRDISDIEVTRPCVLIKKTS